MQVSQPRDDTPVAAMQVSQPRDDAPVAAMQVSQPFGEAPVAAMQVSRPFGEAPVAATQRPPSDHAAGVVRGRAATAPARRSPARPQKA